MSTNREQLVFAAKAMEIKVATAHEHGLFLASAKWWNPLTDDGEALRLAVKLKIDVKHYEDYVVGWFDGGYIGTGKIMYGDDPCAATRLAIVRAAAEIGRTL